MDLFTDDDKKWLTANNLKCVSRVWDDFNCWEGTVLGDVRVSVKRLSCELYDVVITDVNDIGTFGEGLSLREAWQMATDSLRKQALSVLNTSGLLMGMI